MSDRRRQLAADAPWRVGPGGDLPRLSQLRSRRVKRTPQVKYALNILKDPDPIGNGLASVAIIEPAGAECLIPGHTRPVRAFGFQVWPLNLSKFTNPVAKEVKTFGKMVDSAFELMEYGSGNRY